MSRKPRKPWTEEQCKKNTRGSTRTPEQRAKARAYYYAHREQQKERNHLYRQSPAGRAAARAHNRRKNEAVKGATLGTTDSQLTERWRSRDHSVVAKRARCNLYKPESWDLINEKEKKESRSQSPVANTPN